MRYWMSIALIVTVFFSFGCGTPQKFVVKKTMDVGENTALTYPADLRGAYFLQVDNRMRYCAEPFPDVTMSSLNKMIADLTAKLKTGDDLTAKMVHELNVTAAELAGRTQLVLLARELLYRICELSINYPDDQAGLEKATKLYGEVLNVLKDLGEADRAKAVTSEAEAVNEVAEQIKKTRDAQTKDSLQKYLDSISK